ncbi:hypothetical protein ACF3MZ_07525 [Paenibacillaceae bacterium WGS1546]|uniref:hypothetical protein n=1 Tax=Cohnella sp. WGS1546 TaxID=3366810 RepID=UPI00372D39E6
MLLLLLLVIVPSAVGVYYLLKPPIERQSEAPAGNRPLAPVLVHRTAFDDIKHAPATNASAVIRQQTVNE